MTITKAHALIALAAAAVLPLAACADPTSVLQWIERRRERGRHERGHDLVRRLPDPTDEEIAALVPAEVKARGILRNGASADYAPAEFLADDLQTAQGYDVDINKALAKVMGLNDGTTNHAEFPTIIPALGTKFDVGISSFTITSEREAQTNMISYVEVVPPSVSPRAIPRTSTRPIRAEPPSASRPEPRRKTTRPSYPRSAWTAAWTRSRSCRTTSRPTSPPRSPEDSTTRPSLTPQSSATPSLSRVARCSR